VAYVDTRLILLLLALYADSAKLDKRRNVRSHLVIKFNNRLDN
jgi:hypothetical protein